MPPQDAAGRARVTTWVIAALNSVEPFAWNLVFFDGEGAGADWAEKRRAQLEADLDRRLAPLEARLTGRDYLEERFTAGDIIMATALRELIGFGRGFLERYPALTAYVERCTARPAFARALEAQMKPFRESAAA